MDAGYVAGMSVRRVGAEEELLLVDPETRRLTALSDQAVAAHADAEEVTQELFLPQIETSTVPCRTGSELLRGLRAGRRAVGEAAASAGARAVAAGTHPLAYDSRDFTPKARYKRIEALGGEIARQALTCAMHVHVEIADEAEGIAVVDRIQPWLPTLVALSSNSPYWMGRDTSYASWRYAAWTRWPTAGPADVFGSVGCYRSVADKLIAWGAALDEGMLYFDVRLSHHAPTVEVPGR